MENEHFKIVLSSTADAGAAYDAINRVWAWWTENLEGSTLKTQDVFTVRFGETFVSFRVLELREGRSIHWEVTDCYLHWLADKHEWKGTRLLWEITPTAGGSTIDFTHWGLIPGLECYADCAKGWTFYASESLCQLLQDGKGLPKRKQPSPQTA
jgi:hypothetical protein